MYNIYTYIYIYIYTLHQSILKIVIKFYNKNGLRKDANLKQSANKKYLSDSHKMRITFLFSEPEM